MSQNLHPEKKSGAEPWNVCLTFNILRYWKYQTSSHHKLCRKNQLRHEDYLKLCDVSDIRTFHKSQLIQLKLLSILATFFFVKVQHQNIIVICKKSLLLLETVRNTGVLSWFIIFIVSNNHQATSRIWNIILQQNCRIEIIETENIFY